MTTRRAIPATLTAQEKADLIERFCLHRRFGHASENDIANLAGWWRVDRQTLHRAFRSWQEADRAEEH